MLDHLKQRASRALSGTRQVVVSAGGPADIQAEVLPCEAVGLALYVLVPRTSDLLFNLESNGLVVATADAWQLRGTARLLSSTEYPDELAIPRTPEAVWGEVIVIHPIRLYLRTPGGPSETIDIW